MPKTIEEKREYIRRWHEKNPGKSKIYNKVWKEKEPEKFKELNKNKSAKWRKNNPEKHRASYTRSNQKRIAYQREWYFKTKYGITREERDNILAAQGGKCAGCGTGSPEGTGWCVDHCHARLEVRGILCHYCNAALGFMKENPEALRALAGYLEKFRAAG